MAKENNFEKIREEAKSILDDFSGKLSQVSEDELEEPGIERQLNEREEGCDVACGDASFDKEQMFDNAPRTEEDFVVSEKKLWK